MSISRQRCSQSFLDHKIESRQYTPGDLPPWFTDLAHDILSHDRGAGYWVWKPLIIWQTLISLEEGQWLIYTDAGVALKRQPPAFRPIHLYHNAYKHQQWCKGSVLSHFFLHDRQDKALQASVIVMQKSDEAMDLVTDWLRYCLLPGFIDDSPSRWNHTSFIEHRHDQAILGCLAIQRSIALDNHTTSHSWIDHHRLRNDEYMSQSC